ncbi:MAG: hypothetical protein DI547_03355 [Sphingobium sp.]|nr:MAG: hypothetical protein DI547_03355 [Sphingobium sp.]
MLPADSQPAGYEALVQVKSTRKPPLVARMKLSNALRAVKADQPCFIVLVVEQVGGPRIYARHFWHDEIERTLRRVRMAERDGESRLNRLHMQVQMSEADACDDLLGWMGATIGAIKSYSAEKSEFARTIGFEDGYGTLSVTLDGGIDEMLDLQLGLIESLPLSRARYVPQRFGIETPQPRFDVAEAHLMVTPVGKPGDCQDFRVRPGG